MSRGPDVVRRGCQVPPQMPDDPLADLVSAFPREHVQDYTVRLYRDKLSDVPPHLLAEAIHELICTEQRFPTIAQIRSMVAELTLDLPSETEALAQIEARLRHQGDNGDRPAVHPAVRAALNHVGGIPAFRTTDEPTILRGQFARYYREIRGARVRDLQIGGGPAALSAGGFRILTP